MKKVFLLSFVAFSLVGQAQKVSNKLSFQKGQKLEMTAQSQSTISQEIMGQSMDMKMNATMTRIFDIENVANGNATIEHKIKRIQFNMDAMGQEQNFDSEKEDDLKSDMGKNIEKALKNKYTMTVDANGKVTAVKVDDDNPNAKDSSNVMTQGMMEQFGADISVPKIGDATAFKILPEREVKKGDSWVDSTTNKTAFSTGKTTYTIADITAADVVVNFVEENKITRKEDAGGNEVNVTMNTKGTGKITLDRKTGIMKQKVTTTEGTGTVEVMDQSIPMSTKTTETITVKAGG